MNELQEMHKSRLMFVSEVRAKYVLGDAVLPTLFHEIFIGVRMSDVDYPSVGQQTQDLANSIMERYGKFVKFIYQRLVDRTSENFEEEEKP